jgi:hypothetical protein
MVRNTSVPEHKTCSMSAKKFTTLDAASRLMRSMEVAINNMIEEIKKPVDAEINGSARKAELQSIKQTAIDCKELLVERQRLEQMMKDLTLGGEVSDDKDYKGGFAEKFSK